MSDPVCRYRVTLAYDGTDFAGWQCQPAQRTVQAVAETALATIAGAPSRLHASGRTDTGVHARMQVCHFDLGRPIAPGALLKGLNALLPADVRALDVRRAAADFHARKSAVEKEYRYFIWNAPVALPDLRRFWTHVRTPLDARAMQAAAQQLEGRHDFAAFTANPNRVIESTVRNLTCLRVRRSGPRIAIVARSEGFLYRMVRSLAGFLIRVGEGAEAPEAAAQILTSVMRTARVPTAPPEGLFLWRVRYRLRDGARSCYI